MKKTLFTLIALAGAAAAVTEIEAEIAQLPTTIPQITSAPAGWKANFANQLLITDEFVATNLNVCTTLAEDGWHWGLGSLSDLYHNDCSVDPENKAITFHGRNNYNGEFVSFTMDVEELISANDQAYALTGLTFNFARAASSQSDVTFSVWYWDGESTEATALIAKSKTLSASATDYTWTATNEGYKNGKVLVVFSEGSSGQANTINGFSAKATMVTPEPATATLSLLALAGLASRRRRH